MRVAINGFGRIGRGLLRLVAADPDIDVVAINDISEHGPLAYLLKYDTVMGVFAGEVSVDGDVMHVDGDEIAMVAHRDPLDIPWREMGIDVVIESTGVFRQRAQLEKHLEAGAKKVVLTVPPKDEIDAMIVMGVNDDQLEPGHLLVSNASCTTNCLAPVAKVIDETFGLAEGLITTVHAYTNGQRLADVPHKDLRRSRAAAANIIPTTTGAARAVGKVLPQLAGKLDGCALRVPVPDGSIVDLVCRVEAKPSVDEINGAIRAAAEGPLRDIIEYSEVPLVSCDIVGNPHSAIFDAISTIAHGDGWVKVVAWYDNEWGYSNRVVDLLERVAALG